MAKGKEVLTTGEVAAICNVAHRTVMMWLDRGLLKSYCLPLSRRRRIMPQELIRFMKKYHMPIPDELLQNSSRAEKKR
jgi:excisionase family DNA binding protein